MKRTSIKLPDEVDRAMRDEAERRGLTISEWTREAIESHLPQQRGPQRTLGFVGAGSSGRSDISSRVDEILSEGFAIDRDEPKVST